MPVIPCTGIPGDVSDDAIFSLEELLGQRIAAIMQDERPGSRPLTPGQIHLDCLVSRRNQARPFVAVYLGTGFLEEPDTNRGAQGGVNAVWKRLTASICQAFWCVLGHEFPVEVFAVHFHRPCSTYLPAVLNPEAKWKELIERAKRWGWNGTQDVSCYVFVNQEANQTRTFRFDQRQEAIDWLNTLLEDEANALA